MEPPRSTNEPEKRSEANAVPMHDAASGVAMDLELPIAPPWWSEPPKGSWEAGYQLSLLGLEMVKNRPEIWEQRAARMVDVEFVM